MNDNGQRLLELCTYHNLCVTNSFFRTKPQHKVSWRHPRSKHWHQLDLILVRRAALKNVLHTRSYHSADCDTDHSLVCCKIRLTPKRFHCSKQQGNLRIDVNKMSQPDLVQQFAETFESKYETPPPASATEKWKVLRDTIHKTDLATFGKKTSKSHDWFEVILTEMNPVIEAKRAARAEYKEMPSERNLQPLRSARSKAQRTSRQCANKYWTELSQTIQTVSALGNIRGMYEGIKTHPPDLIKRCKDTLLQPLHELLYQCWEEGAFPQDMRDAKIVTLYKNKGERSDCNNYRGISLLIIVGKVYTRVLLARLQKLAERVYPESQCGFRAKRSTIDMVFSLRQLQEKCIEQKQPLYLAFIDLTKAFDLVNRDGLFKALEKIGCPPKLHSLIKSFHTNMKWTFQFNDIRGGVKQGCVLALTLFGIFFALVLRHAFSASQDGIYLRTRSDSRLFNLARLRAKTKVREAIIRDLLFADDAVVAAHTQEELQSLVDRFPRAFITIDDYELEVVYQFTYLGSTIDRRIGKVAELTVKTKMAVYNACVLNTLLYSSETWTTYSTLRWLGHVRRMEVGRIPKDILYGELTTGKRSIGRPQLRFKDMCKRDMKALDINTDTWEDLASDRSSWRSTLHEKLQAGEGKLAEAEAEKRTRRKEAEANRLTMPCTATDRQETIHTCDSCGRVYHSRIGLFSHRRRCTNL
ncbi:uncharacterized protein LOC125036983 [Penaeus chinensis]|uniref:uncharacterized protein LOC125036983 n=1 Tax=Penaeus chinensis TaxID=139456 RepID=UPI001FB7A5FE|nr:uncharacterized protein LOC125036983 [Penaeus chinensis]